MDIEDARRKRQALELEIIERLRAFETETGLRVTGIDADVQYTGTADSPHDTLIVGVSVDVDL